MFSYVIPSMTLVSVMRHRPWSRRVREGSPARTALPSVSTRFSILRRDTDGTTRD
jgi:hypothetical protein